MQKNIKENSNTDKTFKLNLGGDYPLSRLACPGRNRAGFSFSQLVLEMHQFYIAFVIKVMREAMRFHV
jgi:hypothetical protein